MKKIKNGFTLIEIIGIIILLGVIGLLVYPTIMRIIGDSKEDLYKKNVSEIERLAANWASLNESKLPTMDEMGYYIKIEVLKNEGFIEEDIINPKTEEPMLGCVGITYDKPKDKYTYKYYDDCSSFVKPTLSKFNASIAENEYGWRNKDFYVTLESEYLDYYDYCIGDNKCEPNIRMNNASEKILINQEGIKYVCAKGTNKVGITAIECMLYRLDKTKPNVGKIIFSGTTGLDNWFVSDVAVTTTKSTDNLSGIASNTLSPNVTKITVDTKGTTYTLTARDLAGNESSASYAVKVDKTKPIAGVLAINGTLGDNGWYKSNVSFTAANGSDATSGHNKTTINISSITSDTKGTKVIVTTMDNAGNKQTSEQIVKVDKTAPIPGTLVINGKKGFGEWYLSDVTFNVKNGSDSTSGHSNTTSTHTGVAGNTDGTEVMVTTKDVAGNTATRKYIIRIDKNEPTAGTLIINGTLGNNGWYISNVKLSASDVAGVTSTLNITKITSDTKGTEVTMTSKNNTTGAVKVTKYTVKVDKTKPTIGKLVINGTEGNNGWYKSNVTFSVTNGSDTLSGHATTTSSISSITKDTKGTKVILTTKDKAGNITTKEYTIKMDKTAPTTPTSMNFVFGNWSQYTDNTWTNQSIYAASTTSNPGPSGSSDTTSGLWKYQISTDNVNWVDYNYTASGIYLMSTDGVHTRYFRAVDNAGNVSSIISRTAKVDKTAPTVPTVTYNGGSNSCSWKNNYNLTLNSSDSLSGVRVYQVDWTGDSASNSDVTSNFIPWNGYSSCNNRFRAVDNAGNVSEWTGVHHIHMDTEKPAHTNWWWGTVNKDIAQLYIQTTDNVGISRVQCPTSTATGGYNNWHWFNAVWDSSQNAYRCDITPSTFGHYNQTYTTHLYIYDHAGNGGYYNATNANIPSNDTTKPTITGLYAKGAITNGVGTNTISATLQDNVALSGYYVTSDSTYSCSNATPGNWNGISGTSYSMNEVVTEQGTYYIWVKDATGNTSCTSKYIYRTGISTASTSTCAINNATAVDSGGTITLYLTTTCSCTTQNTCKNGWDYGTDSARSWLAISVNGSNMVVYNIGTVNKSQSFQDIAYTNTSNNSVAAYANSTIFAINGGFLVVSNGYGRTGITSTVDFGISKIVADNVIIYDGGFVNY